MKTKEDKFAISAIVVVALIAMLGIAKIHSDNNYIDRHRACLNMVYSGFQYTYPLVKDEAQSVYFEYSLNELRQCKEVVK